MRVGQEPEIVAGGRQRRTSLTSVSTSFVSSQSKRVWASVRSRSRRMKLSLLAISKEKELFPKGIAEVVMAHLKENPNEELECEAALLPTMLQDVVPWNGLDRSVVAVDGREDIWRGAGACPGWSATSFANARSSVSTLFPLESDAVVEHDNLSNVVRLDSERRRKSPGESQECVRAARDSAWRVPGSRSFRRPSVRRVCSSPRVSPSSRAP